MRQVQDHDEGFDGSAETSESSPSPWGLPWRQSFKNGAGFLGFYRKETRTPFSDGGGIARRLKIFIYCL